MLYFNFNRNNEYLEWVNLSHQIDRIIKKKKKKKKKCTEVEGDRHISV